MSLYGWSGPTHFFKCPLCDWSAEEEFERLKFLTQEHMEQHHAAQIPGKPQQPRDRERLRPVRDFREPAARQIEAAEKRVQLVKNPKTGIYEPEK